MIPPRDTRERGGRAGGQVGVQPDPPGLHKDPPCGLKNYTHSTVAMGTGPDRGATVEALRQAADGTFVAREGEPDSSALD